MRIELATIDKYRVWTVIDRMRGMRTIGGKWVYARKIVGKTGLPSTCKAITVAKGYSQIEGIDFQDVFASVAHKDSNRMFLATVNHLDMECDQVDIIAAFLNGDDLVEYILMEPPEGSGIPKTKCSGSESHFRVCASHQGTSTRSWTDGSSHRDLSQPLQIPASMSGSQMAKL